MARKVLVVDDEPHILVLIKTFLNSKNIEVVTAENGIEAVEKAVRENPDLILLDVLMPEMTGFDAMQKIRELDHAVSKVPIFIITGKPSMKKYFDSASIQSMVSKPFNMKDLFVQIQEILEAASEKEAGKQGSPAVRQRGGGGDAGDRSKKKAKKKNETTGKNREGEGNVGLMSRADNEAVRAVNCVVIAGLEEYIVEKVKKHLESKSIKATRAFDEAEAVKETAKLQPDMILCQFWEEPEKFNADKIFKKLSSDPKTKNIPRLIFCSAGLGFDAVKAFPNQTILTYSESAELIKKLTTT